MIKIKSLSDDWNPEIHMPVKWEKFTRELKKKSKWRKIVLIDITMNGNIGEIIRLYIIFIRLDKTNV